MRAQRLARLVLVLVSGLILVRLVTGPLQHNIAQVMALHAFSGQYGTSRSIGLWQSALSLSCIDEKDCRHVALEPGRAIIDKARDEFIPDPTPMRIVDRSLRIPSEDFIPSGLPGSLQGIDSPGILYGPGTLNMRLLLVAEQRECWQFAVKAKHDSPPPVELEIWLDRNKVGTLSYDRGDESWAIMSLNKLVDPNMHLLGVTFANDFQDKDAGTDRNAYIEYIQISRLEESFCKDD